MLTGWVISTECPSTGTYMCAGRAGKKNKIKILLHSGCVYVFAKSLEIGLRGGCLLYPVGKHMSSEYHDANIAISSFTPPLHFYHHPFFLIRSVHSYKRTTGHPFDVKQRKNRENTIYPLVIRFIPLFRQLIFFWGVKILLPIAFYR